MARPAMRKSEQRGPRNQMFGPIRRSSQAPASPVKSEEVGSVVPQLAEGSNDFMSVTASTRTQEIPQTPTPDPRLRARQSMNPSLPPVQPLTATTNARPSTPTPQDPETVALLRAVSPFHELITTRYRNNSCALCIQSTITEGLWFYT